uniref:Fasciculation and elongation protein zeta 1 (zygin I) n=1 Tax=Eptatretus burgeri TaxID=7764 RepID=A0A8C4R445_EPTBU
MKEKEDDLGLAAPLADFDEEWQDLYELRPRSKAIDTTKTPRSESAVQGGQEAIGLEDLAELDGFSGEIVSFKSMEDLVNGFDEKLTVCFHNLDSDTGHIAPVKALVEENVSRDDGVWNTVTDNFGNAPSLEWNSSHSRDLQISSLDLQDKPVPDEDDNAAPCDEEELSEQLNMHSIIVSCISDEPILTAEQVIEEIEEMMMMHESPEGEGETSNKSDHMSLLSQELGALKRSSIAKACDDGLRCLSSGELCELLEEMEGAVQHFSQELVQQLALRDELEFEKEVKNSFISALIEVQTKQKELREIQRKKKRRSMGPGDNKSDKPSRMPVSRFSMEGLSNVIQNGLRQTFGGSVGEKQYLTTVIPYEKKGSPPSVEDLQAITKILFAMKDDSEKVPTLLTDYILKVLCPT